MQTARAPQRTAAQAGSPIVAAPIAVPVTPLTPEGQRAQTRAAADEALRGDMPNSGRILGTETSVRLYGFIKTSMLGNLDMVNRGNEPSVQGVPLRGSAADQQTGDLQFSARRSRIGFDTLTPNGGTSPAMNLVPDLLGRLNYRAAFGKASLRGHMRQLRMNTNGTNAARAATFPKIRPACGEAP